MAGFDPSTYADHVEQQGRRAFDPATYADAAERGGFVAPEPDVKAGGPVTLGAGATGAMHFLRHESFGLGDKLAAAGESVYEAAGDKSRDGLLAKLASLPEKYRRNLAFNDKLMDASDEAHPVARWVGNVGGFGVSAAALAAAPGLAELAGLQEAAPAATAVAQALPRMARLAALAKEGRNVGSALGAVGAYGNDRSSSASDTLLNTGLGAAFGAASGYAAPYVSEGVGLGAQYLGDKTRNLAGWLKVNSIHPTPTLGEAMEDIPGGVPAVGRELLERGIGGFTKAGTAKQVDAAFGEATSKANQLAAAHDATGASVDVGGALAAAEARAKQLMAEPASREAGQKLMDLVSEYAEKYGAGESAPASAVDALATKRALGKIAYGAKAEFKLNKNPVVGDYGAGVRTMERGVDDALDGSLGPDFDAANLLVRRLGGAKQAVERAAARTAGNHIVGLLPYMAGLSGAVGGHMTGHAGPEALAYGASSLLASKYGAQTLARLLYSPVGGGLGLLGRGLQALPGAVSGGVAAEETAPLAGRLSGLLRPSPAPAMADKEELRRRATLAALIRGGGQ
jgi:hypothetical protein